ncbi:ATP-binding protein [Myxococcus sp. K15C18031901]|uniref:sensor histidine kinase n=1 Tax=Myxococcus dinghuensis TaxID=2906761 RepID=UPI0020A76107|nr:ATP-binding protein [Myxococcus dinghuensis]MCP3100913.1 ATP-binding protein [Myxococcus dinghuensis]
MSDHLSAENELEAILDKVRKAHGPDFAHEPHAPPRHSWALEGLTGALAVLRDDAVLLVNMRWQSLSRARGPWRHLTEAGREEGPALLTLRSVGAAAARQLDGLPHGAACVTRYGYAGGHQQLEVRVCRLDAPPAPPVVLVLARDVTEEARAEEVLERERRALAEREHLRMLSEQASGIAHDLGSLLVAMKLRLELLQANTSCECAPTSHVDTLLRIVEDATTRLTRLRDYARRRPEAAVEPVQLADVVRDAVEIARGELETRALREGLSLRLDVAVPRLPLVESSAADLRCVFLNLLRNARDAMPRGGTLRIRGHARNGFAVVTVEDEGTGIPEEHLRSIFQPFFTTKGQHGTGLGLSMASEVVTRARGTLTAANRPEGGAIFTLSLPARSRRTSRTPVYSSG